MIPCPSCGTRNRRGSKYCSHCGQPLGTVFDVGCPACDRLNPGGSAFCAFCGARIVGPPPGGGLAAAQPSATVQANKTAAELLPSEAKGAEPAARPQREVPSWLYEPLVERPAVEAPPSAESSCAAVEPRLEQSKYLSDIPGTLPKIEGWLSSVRKVEGKPVADQARQSKRKAQGGCLILPLLALLGAIGLVLMIAV